MFPLFAGVAMGRTFIRLYNTLTTLIYTHQNTLNFHDVASYHKRFNTAIGFSCAIGGEKSGAGVVPTGFV